MNICRYTGQILSEDEMKNMCKEVIDFFIEKALDPDGFVIDVDLVGVNKYKIRSIEFKV